MDKIIMQKIIDEEVEKRMKETRQRRVDDIYRRADEYGRSLQKDGPYGEDCSAGELEGYSDTVSQRVNDYINNEFKKL